MSCLSVFNWFKLDDDPHELWVLASPSPIESMLIDQTSMLAVAYHASPRSTREIEVLKQIPHFFTTFEVCKASLGTLWSLAVGTIVKTILSSTYVQILPRTLIPPDDLEVADISQTGT